MGVVQNIVEIMSRGAQNSIIYRVHVGLVYSAVQLKNRSTGVAYTFPKGERCGPRLCDNQKPLAGRKASEIIPYLGCKNLATSSLALAVTNALLTTKGFSGDVTSGDVLENVNIHEGDQVCMVGCFLPLIKALEKRGAKVISVDELRKPGALPPKEIEKILPESTIAIITATAIINNTIDHLLDLSRSCREVVVLGPSTPLLKEAFHNTPVTWLSGINVLDPEKVLQIISEGGGFREFKYFTRKVNVRLMEM